MSKKLRVQLVIALLAIGLTVFLLSCATPDEVLQTETETSSTPETTSPSDITPETQPPIIIEIMVEKELEQSSYPLEYVDNRNENLKRIMECKDRLAAAEAMLQAAQDLGYEETHPVVVLAQQEIEQIRKDIEFYEARWNALAVEYPVACEVWRFFIEECGYSEVVAAGIIGNMMIECGGHTLELQWDIYNSSKHYGLVQWSPKYYPHIQGASLQEQLEFLKTSIPEVFNGWSGKREKCLFNDFIAIQNCRDAALRFAQVYERPGSIGTARLNAAEKALSYFCDTIK